MHMHDDCFFLFSKGKELKEVYPDTAGRAGAPRRGRRWGHDRHVR
jgi:hypothetical protein